MAKINAHQFHWEFEYDFFADLYATCREFKQYIDSAATFAEGLANYNDYLEQRYRDYCAFCDQCGM